MTLDYESNASNDDFMITKGIKNHTKQGYYAL